MKQVYCLAALLGLVALWQAACSSNSTPTSSGPAATATWTPTSTATVTPTSTPTFISTVVETSTPLTVSNVAINADCNTPFYIGTISAGQRVAVKGDNLPTWWGDFIDFTAGTTGTYTLYLDDFTSVNGNPGQYEIFLAGGVCGAGNVFPFTNSPVLQYTASLTSGTEYEVQPYSASVTGPYRLTIQGP